LTRRAVRCRPVRGWECLVRLRPHRHAPPRSPGGAASYSPRRQSAVGASAVRAHSHLPPSLGAPAGRHHLNVFARSWEGEALGRCKVGIAPLVRTFRIRCASIASAPSSFPPLWGGNVSATARLCATKTLLWTSALQPRQPQLFATPASPSPNHTSPFSTHGARVPPLPTPAA
jgi:hypothetical protein